jgi:hypothetical protein
VAATRASGRTATRTARARITAKRAFAGTCNPKPLYTQPQTPIYTQRAIFPSSSLHPSRSVTRQQVRRHVQERRLRVRRVAVQRCVCRPRLRHAPPARVPLTRLLLTPPPDGGYYSGAFARGQPAAGPGVFTFANGNKQSGKWIEQARCPRPVLCTANAVLLPCVCHLTLARRRRKARRRMRCPSWCGSLTLRPAFERRVSVISP